MSNAALKTVIAPEAHEKPATFPAMLDRYKDEIARALPKHINPDRMARVALTCFRLTPKLAQCQPASVFAAVIQAAQLGLEPGLNGRCYLIPYGDECQMVPGWKGLLELVNRSGRAVAWTGGVFDGDKFDYELGDSPRVKHLPGNEDDPAKLIYTYAIGRIRGNDWPIVEVWTNEKIVRHRNRYNKVGKRHYSYDNWEMYARKIPLLQVLKYLPSSPELETAIALSDAADAGLSQGLTIEGAIAGAYEAPPPGGGQAGADGEAQGAPLTLAEVQDAINNANDPASIDAAKALIPRIANEAHRAEADVAERAKRRQINAALDKAAG